MPSPPRRAGAGLEQHSRGWQQHRWEQMRPRQNLLAPAVRVPAPRGPQARLQGAVGCEGAGQPAPLTPWERVLHTQQLLEKREEQTRGCSAAPRRQGPTGGLPTPLQDAQHSWTHSSPALGGQSQGTELANTGNYLLEQCSKKNPHLPLFLLAPEVASLLRVVFSSLETALTRDVAKREQPSFLTRGTRCR